MSFTYGRFRAETAVGGFDFGAEIDPIAVGACYVSTLELRYKDARIAYGDWVTARIAYGDWVILAGRVRRRACRLRRR